MDTASTSAWSQNWTVSDTGPNDYSADSAEATLEDYDEIVWNAVEPNWLEYGSLGVFALLLITGLVGNFLVMFVVVRNECMRTRTNYFLVNLALSDFMVLLFCLPFTILWEITKTWWFGTALCKIIVYWQTLSVSVSILTLMCISVERWHAICHPLSFKNTFKRTRISLTIIWISAALLSLPEMIILKAKPLAFIRANYTSTYLTQCTHTWDDSLQQAYQLAQTSVLYVLPLCCMGVLYGHIAYVLWLKSIPPSDCSASPRVPRVTSAKLSASARRNSSAPRVTFNPATEYLPVPPCDLSAVDRMAQRRHSSAESLKSLSSAMPAAKSTNAVGGARAPAASLDQWKEREIMHRKKAAKMLIAIVALFGICYLPTHVLNILTYFGAVPDVRLGLKRSAMYLSIRFMCYFNSCVNPIVYNFMSEKFQKEFRRACHCLPAPYRRSNRYVSGCATYESSALIGQNRSRRPSEQPV